MKTTTSMTTYKLSELVQYLHTVYNKIIVNQLTENTFQFDMDGEVHISAELIDDKITEMFSSYDRRKLQSNVVKTVPFSSFSII
jgi:hypothetical protein